MGQLNTAQRIPFTVTYLDDQVPAQPAKVESITSFDTSDATVAAMENVTLSTNGLTVSGEVVGVTPGSVTVAVRVDARFGPDVKEITTTGSLDVDPAPVPEAGSGTMVFGAPVPK